MASEVEKLEARGLLLRDRDGKRLFAARKRPHRDVNLRGSGGQFTIETTDGAVIGQGSVVGAGALITKGTVIPPNSLVLGSPAKVVKDLGPESADNNRKWAEKYVKVATRYTERVINPGF